MGSDRKKVEREMKREIRKKCAELTDDDVDYISGNRERFIGLLQQRYARSKEQTERDLDQWRREITQTADRR